MSVYTSDDVRQRLCNGFLLEKRPSLTPNEGAWASCRFPIQAITEVQPIVERRIR